MFKENPLSVGTRLGYIFVLPTSLYRSLSEVAFGNLESGKLRFGPYDTLAHTYRTISLVSRPRRFLFTSRSRVRAPARNARLRPQFMFPSSSPQGKSQLRLRC